MGKAVRLRNFGSEFVCEMTCLEVKKFQLNYCCGGSITVLAETCHHFMGGISGENGVKIPIKALFLHFFVGVVDAPPFAKYPWR